MGSYTETLQDKYGEAVKREEVAISIEQRDLYYLTTDCNTVSIPVERFNEVTLGMTLLPGILERAMDRRVMRSIGRVSLQFRDSIKQVNDPTIIF